MDFVDKSYYFMYCFNTVKQDIPLDTLNDKELAVGFSGAKRLYGMAICLYVSALFVYSDILLRIIKNPHGIMAVAISIWALIFVVIYFYFSPRENELVKRYITLRRGKENSDWLKGFVFFVLSIVMFIMGALA